MTRLTLTFDNGPTPGITDQVLGTLAEFGILSTFFLVGEQLDRPGARRLAEQARAAGHRIGNHTLSHGAPLGDEPGRSRQEIRGMQEKLGDLAGDELLFRPNGRGRLGPHILDREACATLVEIKATTVLWTSVPRDRSVHVPTPDAWMEQAKRDVEAQDWTLMVLHDRPAGHPSGQPMGFLGDFLRWTRERGVEIEQDYPPESVIIRRGIPQMDLTPFVTP